MEKILQLIYARKARRKGYKFLEIDRNNYINDIYKINTSSLFRQGRKMSESYLKKVDNYKNKKITDILELLMKTESL